MPRAGAFVAAIDAKTGRQLWRTPRTEGVGWGTPIAIRAGGRDEIIVSSQRAVRAYDPDTGRELWSARGQYLGSNPDSRCRARSRILPVGPRGSHAGGPARRLG